MSVSVRFSKALPALMAGWLAVATGAAAQGFPPPSGGGFGGGGGQGFPPQGAGQNNQGQNNPGQNNSGQNNQGGPQAFGDEDRDFGVPPQGNLQTNVGTPTPTRIPGGGVITTVQLRNNLPSGQLVVIDAWDDSQHARLPNAVFLPFAGAPGSFSDQYQQQLQQALGQITNGNQQALLVFYCAGPICWESYNAALRAIHLGYRNVLWYRGGVAAWRAAGLPLQQATAPGGSGAMNGGPPQQGGFPPPGNFPQQGGGFPQQSNGFPQQGGGFPQQGGGFQQQGNGFQQQGGFPPPTGNAQPQSGGFPQGGGFPQQ